MRKKIGIAAVVVASLTAVPLFLTKGASDAAGQLPYTDVQAIARGEALYADNCASCHGDNLQGQEDWQRRGSGGKLPAPPHDETGHSWHHPDTQLILITKYGTERVVGQGYKSDMAGFGDVLSDDQILDVLAYIKSTWPDEIIEMHDRSNDAAD